MNKEWLPNEVVHKHNYIKVNEIYMTTIEIYDFPIELESLKTISFLLNDRNNYIAFYLHKQNTKEFLKKISCQISHTKGEIKQANPDQLDIDILDKNKIDAQKLRYEIQVNSEEIFAVSIYITIADKQKENVLYQANKYLNYLYTKNIKGYFLNFRQLSGYLSTLPIACNMYQTKQYLTTSNLACLYPFFTNSILEKNGILYGYIQDKVCLIDNFNPEHQNANICVLGSSGSGKSFFIKSMIIKNYLRGIRQIIIDMEGEYQCLTKNLSRNTVALKDQAINLMELNKEEIDQSEFLFKKVDKLINQIQILSNYSFKENEKKSLKEDIIEGYTNKGINANKETAYVKDSLLLNKKIKTGKEIPCISELTIHQKKVKEVIDKVKFEYPCFCNYSSIKQDCDLIHFYIQEKDEHKLDKIVYFIMTYFVQEYMQQKTIFYIDEIWKLFKLKGYSSSKIIELYKTIRKRNGAIVTITQDVADIVGCGEMEYGKILFNNSFIKLFFNMPYVDLDTIRKIGALDEQSIQKVGKLNKGEAILVFKNNTMELNIKPSEYEKELIEGEKNDYNSTR